MRLRAAVLEEFGQPLVIQGLELDEPKGHEALVRLVACGSVTQTCADGGAGRHPVG
jgi:S-(hydroxymethyl)glutathione dehydrogenase/alcohol dehydrogenase